MGIFSFLKQFRISRIPAAVVELTEAATASREFVTWARQRYANDMELIRRANLVETEISEAVAAVKGLWN